jgi:hypothetical protein
MLQRLCSIGSAETARDRGVLNPTRPKGTMKLNQSVCDTVSDKAKHVVSWPEFEPGLSAHEEESVKLLHPEQPTVQYATIHILYTNVYVYGYIRAYNSRSVKLATMLVLHTRESRIQTDAGLLQSERTVLPRNGGQFVSTGGPSESYMRFLVIRTA